MAREAFDRRQPPRPAGRGARSGPLASRGASAEAGDERVRLEWPGRQWIPTDPEASPVGNGQASPRLEPFEDCGGTNVLAFGDAAAVARALHGHGVAGGVDLVYVDPPFASQADYVHEARLDGPADGRIVRSHAYADRLSVGEYLEMLAPRLEAAATLLAPSGTLWVHLDWRAAYLVRVVLDEILGRDAFVNEIVWRRAPNLGRQAASGQFGRTVDTLVVYGKRPGAKLTPPTRLEPIEERVVRWDDEGRPFTSAPRGDYTDESIARLEQEGRVHRTATGRVYIKYFLVKDAEGRLCRERRIDALWTDVSPLRHAPPRERTGFPTQKPRALLDRIVACATRPGGLVADLFCGSGTAGEAAHALGRRFVLGDHGPTAISTARARLLRAGAPFALQRCDGEALPAGRPPVVDVERTDDGTLVVRLREPAEPAAWAVDADPTGTRPFRAAWHAERELGPRPAPAPREARVRARQAVDVRVWSEDGSVATQRVSA